jgi:hypothetical protein
MIDVVLLKEYFPHVEWTLGEPKYSGMSQLVTIANRQDGELADVWADSS